MNLTRNSYMMTLWFIRSYRELQEKVQDEIDATPNHEGGGKGSGISDPTAKRASAIENYMEDIRLIKETAQKIPSEYRRAIMKNILDREPYPLTASRKTFGKYKRRFVVEIAMAKGWAMFNE